MFLAAPTVAPDLASEALAATGTVVRDVAATGTIIHVKLDADVYSIGSDELLEWVRRSASIVAAYYGRFPVPVVDLTITSTAGNGVPGGRTFADPLPRIELRVGRGVSRDELLDDWVLVHEMTHLALPEVGRAHAWLAEGLATYVEGVARVQAGNLAARELWQEDVASMPKGMPQPDDEGLDRTHTWGRTYWGGALFCLAADVEIRERSGGRYGLQDALRAVLRQSGGMMASWPVERVFRTGDAATGTTVLSDLYESMGRQPTAPDIQGLWRRLGVHVDDGVVSLESGSRQAEIRDAITRRPSE